MLNLRIHEKPVFIGWNIVSLQPIVIIFQEIYIYMRSILSGREKGAAGESDDYFTCILVHKFYSDHLWLWAEHITTYLSEI